MIAFAQKNGVGCSCCGGVFAKPSNGEFCRTCSVSFSLFLGPDLPSEEKKVQFLANRIVTELKNLKRNGVCGRCEEIQDGFQCDRTATSMVNGKRFCERHSWNYSSSVSNSPNPYGAVRELISEVCKADPLFKNAIMAGMQ